MKPIQAFSISLASFICAAACSDDLGDAPVDTGRNQPDPIEPEMQRMYDESGIETEGVYDPDRIQPVDRNPGSDPDYPEDNEDIHISGDPSEKAVIARLQGWSIQSVLAFQDGVSQIIGGVNYPDMCSATTFGICDNDWHAQAKYTDFGAAGENGGSILNGLCGVGGPLGTLNEWRACALPYITKAVDGHNVTWKFNRTTCPSTMRPQFDAAIVKAHQTMLVGGLSFTETTGVPEIEYRCHNILDEDGGTLADWTPTGIITPRWAAPVDFIDECHAAGFNLRPEYYAAIDMFYYYSNNRIRLDSAALLQHSAGCGMTTQGLVNLISNTIVHEVGHMMGFTHQAFLDGGGSVMKAAQTCDGKFVQFWHGFMATAIRDLDVRLGASLIVLDDDISCLIPSKGNN